MTASAAGWAVIDDEGLKVRTVSDTRRAALVNWLVTEAELVITNADDDTTIERMWDEQRGDSRVVPVTIKEA